MNLILFGPPGSGKTTVGRLCAQKLKRKFVDTDEEIIRRTGYTIPRLFAEQGEAAFRALEADVIAEVASQNDLVVAVGGGALAATPNRVALAKSGLIVCLRAGPETILERLQGHDDRPLLAGDPQTKIEQLLAKRQALYDSFEVQVQTDDKTPKEVGDQITESLLPWEAEIATPTGSYPVVLGAASRTYLPRLLHKRDLPLPQLIITDTNVEALWARELAAQWKVPLAVIPDGETHKTLDTVRDLYESCLQYELDRHSLVVAVGGGVLGDIAGFAAATYMRGIHWVNVPTTLLAMVDASIGGKVGVDLPQGKNLIGAFHPPAMVVADPQVLSTLPNAEYKAGLTEVIKHGVISDPALFAAIPTSLPLSRALIQQAMAVKIEIVQRDPFEQGERAKLNLGHTIGHGIEAASDYQLRHGEAIAIGLVAEARLAVMLGLAADDLPQTIASTLEAVGLPVSIQGLDPAHVRTMMQSDKKKRGKRLRFALPTAIGAVKYGVTAPDEVVMEAIHSVYI